MQKRILFRAMVLLALIVLSIAFAKYNATNYEQGITEAVPDKETAIEIARVLFDKHFDCREMYGEKIELYALDEKDRWTVMLNYLHYNKVETEIFGSPLMNDTDFHVTIRKSDGRVLEIRNTSDDGDGRYLKMLEEQMSTDS